MENNIDFYINKIKNLEECIKKLEEENNILKNKLEPYLNSTHKYYEKNKDIIFKKATERLKKLSVENPEKIKEYRRTAYQNRKKKLELEKNNANSNIENQNQKE